MALPAKVYVFSDDGEDLVVVADKSELEAGVVVGVYEKRKEGTFDGTVIPGGKKPKKKKKKKK